MNLCIVFNAPFEYLQVYNASKRCSRFCSLRTWCFGESGAAQPIFLMDLIRSPAASVPMVSAIAAEITAISSRRDSPVSFCALPSAATFSASISDEETEPEVSARRPVTNPHITPISLTMAMRTTSPTNTTASPTSGTIKVFMQNTGPFQILGGLRRMR